MSAPRPLSEVIAADVNGPQPMQLMSCKGAQNLQTMHSHAWPCMACDHWLQLQSTARTGCYAGPQPVLAINMELENGCKPACKESSSTGLRVAVAGRSPPVAPSCRAGMCVLCPLDRWCLRRAPLVVQRIDDTCIDHAGVAAAPKTLTVGG